MIEHMVFVRVKADAPPRVIAEVFDGLAALKGVVPGLTRFASGPNNSSEGLSRGYTHGFVVTFTDKAARDAYLPHPAHVAAAQKLLAITDGGVDGVLVLDIES